MKAGIFIMSCDNTRDILDHFIKGYNLYWINNTLKIYLGTNDAPLPKDFNNVNLLSVPKSNWKKETIDQLTLLQMTEPTLTHVIVILDDFIFNNHVENNKLTNILYSGKYDNIKYLRLKRLEDGLYEKALQFTKIEKWYSKEKIFKIRKSHPYYTSLQIALWDINYLKSCLVNIENIWDFELQKSNHVEHYSVLNNIFFYKHIVEKGKWEFYASNYCKKYLNYFNPGDRKFQSYKFSNKLINYIKKIKFLIFGYWLTSIK
jgi:hypothetical protein